MNGATGCAQGEKVTVKKGGRTKSATLFTPPVQGSSVTDSAGTVFAHPCRIPPYSCTPSLAHRPISRGGFADETSLDSRRSGSVQRRDHRPAPPGWIRIVSAQARRLEDTLGLKTHSLEKENILSIVDDIPNRNPARPTQLQGNSLFLGVGKGLKGGGPEVIVTQRVPTAGGTGIRQIVVEVID